MNLLLTYLLCLPNRPRPTGGAPRQGGSQAALRPGVARGHGSGTAAGPAAHRPREQLRRVPRLPPGAGVLGLWACGAWGCSLALEACLWIVHCWSACLGCSQAEGLQQFPIHPASRHFGRHPNRLASLHFNSPAASVPQPWRTDLGGCQRKATAKAAGHNERAVIEMMVCDRGLRSGGFASGSYPTWGGSYLTWAST